VPLSEEELRLLEQMEQALAQEDPKFASTLRGSTLERTARMRTIAAAVAFVAGIVMMMGGAVSEQYWLAIIGFLVMLASATLGLAAWRGRHAPASASHQRGDTPEAAFNFDDNPQRFDVIEGGKTRRPKRSGRSGRTPRNKAPKHGTFMQRMEERWERRRHQGF
jgi:hypothetical protein